MSLFSTLLVFGLLLMGSVLPGYAQDQIVCEVREPADPMDDIKNDGTSYFSDGVNEPHVIKVGFALAPSWSIADIRAYAVRQCTTTSGSCTLTGGYFCIPLGNCSGYTLPNGYYLGTFQTGYWALGAVDDGTHVQMNLGLPSSATGPNYAPGVSVRYRLWMTRGGSSAFPNTIPWQSGTNFTMLCKDL